MTQQTAVEWLVEQIKSDQNQKALSANQWMQVIEQAKQMEKEQKIKLAEQYRERCQAPIRQSKWLEENS